jgi:hypothetical protein
MLSRFARPRDHSLCVDVRRAFEFVDDVTVGAQGKTCVVPELPGNVDDGSALVEQEGGELVSQVIWPGRRAALPRSMLCEKPFVARTGRPKVSRGGPPWTGRRARRQTGGSFEVATL